MTDKCVLRVYFRGGPLDTALATLSVPMEEVAGGTVGLCLQPDGIVGHYEIQDGPVARAFDASKQMHPNLSLVARFIAPEPL